MKRISSYINMFLAACLYAILSNVELLYLKNDDVSSLFCTALFDVQNFMEDKQFFLVVNVVFGLFLSCYLCSRDIVNYYTIYTFNRISSKTIFFLKRMVLIFVKQLIFSAAYCSVIMVLCAISCRRVFDADCYGILLKSIAAITYSGAFFSIISCTAALFYDARSAILIILIIMLISAFASMTLSDLLAGSTQLLIINPITTITIAAMEFSPQLISALLLSGMVILIEMLIAVWICQRKELQ